MLSQGNEVGDVGAAAVSEALKANTALTRMKLARKKNGGVVDC